MNTYKRTPLKFFLLVFVLSIPFWILGALTQDLTKILPIKLPISALMAFCPMLAAMVLVYRARKTQGLKELLQRAFDFKRITDKRWYLPIVFLMPCIAALSYGYMKMTGAVPTEPNVSFLTVFIFFFVYFIGAVGEELGWSGYVIEPLQNRYGALKASIVLGLLWAIWHIIPWSQTHQTPVWIIWQSLGTVFFAGHHGLDLQQYWQKCFCHGSFSHHDQPQSLSHPQLWCPLRSIYF